MPGLPFATPVTLEELWSNILHDLGAAPYTASNHPTDMHGILLAVSSGLYQTNLSDYGDGSDGVQTFDGTTTILGLAPSTSVYTLTRDIWLGNLSTINSGVTIKTAGFRIFVQGELVNNGTIQSNGNAAAANAGAAGAALSYTGTLSSGIVGTAGGASGTTTATGGTNASVGSIGASPIGVGGVGGASTVTVNAGGAAGTVTAIGATAELPRSTPMAIVGKLNTTTGFVALAGGTGGGSGGGDATYGSGSGGGGGGIVVVVAQRVGGTGTISANGGAGGSASTNAAATSGGGGGGGGGLVIVVSRSVQPVAVNSSGPLIANQTITAAGGAGGASGTAGGVAGTAGGVGTVILLAT